MKSLFFVLFIFILSTNAFGQQEADLKRAYQDKSDIEQKLKQPNLEPLRKKELTDQLGNINLAIKKFEPRIIERKLIHLNSDNQKKFSELCQRNPNMTYEEKIKAINDLSKSEPTKTITQEQYAPVTSEQKVKKTYQEPFSPEDNRELLDKINFIISDNTNDISSKCYFYKDHFTCQKASMLDRGVYPPTKTDGNLEYNVDFNDIEYIWISGMETSNDNNRRNYVRFRVVIGWNLSNIYPEIGNNAICRVTVAEIWAYNGYNDTNHNNSNAGSRVAKANEIADYIKKLINVNTDWVLPIHRQ